MWSVLCLCRLTGFVCLSCFIILSVIDYFVMLFPSMISPFGGLFLSIFRNCSYRIADWSEDSFLGGTRVVLVLFYGHEKG